MSLVMNIEREGLTPEKRGRYVISVMGCGRRGLPLACLFAEAGFKVMGVDANQHVVNLIERGKAPFVEAGLDVLIKKHVKDGSLTATKDVRAAASKSDAIVLIATTRLDRKKKPNYTTVERTCREVGMGMRSGSLIICGGASGLGITETLAKEILENASGLKAGTDFGLAYASVRAAPGQVLQDIVSYPQVLGAINDQSLKVACLVFGTVAKGGVVEVRDLKTAEAVGLFETVQHDVNMALANEFALFCEKTGIDFIEAVKASGTPPNCHLLFPGVVGGCLSRDSHLLVNEAEDVNARLRIVELARKVNDETLGYALCLTRSALRRCGKTLNRAVVVVFGVSCRPNVKEVQGSPTLKFVKMLLKRGVKVRVYDPYFSLSELRGFGFPAEETLTKTVEGADCLIILVGHDKFNRLNLKRIRFLVKKPAAIVDMGRIMDPGKAEKAGFTYRGLGRGLQGK
jgi:nucleotide sugar dehydrogenase